MSAFAAIARIGEEDDGVGSVCSPRCGITNQEEGTMSRRVTLIALFAILFAVFAQTVSANPLSAKNASVFTAKCGATQLMVVVNGNGEFTPAHVIGSTAVFIPMAFNLTFSFTPTGGATESETDTPWHTSPGIQPPMSCLQR